MVAEEEEEEFGLLPNTFSICQEKFCVYGIFGNRWTETRMSNFNRDLMEVLKLVGVLMTLLFDLNVIISKKLFMDVILVDLVDGKTFLSCHLR